MTVVQALWLGVVQGLTEFLPISSDGHLTLAHALLGASSGEDLFFDLMLHIGTLIAVFTVFGGEIVRLFRDGVRGLRLLPREGPKQAFAASEGLRVGTFIVVASLPTALIGLALKKSVESHAFGVAGTALFLILNGLTLWSSRYAPVTKPATPGSSVAGLRLPAAFWVGVAQGLAVLPGVSRSGSTIVAALWLGADRGRAAEISFLMAIPAIVGAFILELDASALAAAGQAPLPYAVGTLLSAVVGVFALRLLIRMLRGARFHDFAWYCWALGLIALAVTWLRG